MAVQISKRMLAVFRGGRRVWVAACGLDKPATMARLPVTIDRTQLAPLAPHELPAGVRPKQNPLRRLDLLSEGSRRKSRLLRRLNSVLAMPRTLGPSANLCHSGTKKTGIGMRIRLPYNVGLGPKALRRCTTVLAGSRRLFAAAPRVAAVCGALPLARGSRPASLGHCAPLTVLTQVGT